ncbi:twin-arginine translocase TatA/TatE family subunit [Eggerthellaceae bacterium zg-887]|nr:twin-arginine translocase TatA/TatE family subunit [Xiamenia xianingshaonis]
MWYSSEASLRLVPRGTASNSWRIRMKILGMGVPELLIILVVILLIFGPKNLPKLGSALGKTVKNLREGMGSNELEDADEEEEVYEEEVVEEEPAKKETTTKKTTTVKKKKVE